MEQTASFGECLKGEVPLGLQQGIKMSNAAFDAKARSLSVLDSIEPVTGKRLLAAHERE